MTDDKNKSELDAVVKGVKQELRGALFTKTDEQIKKIGYAAKRSGCIKKEEDICQWIKHVLMDEINDGFIEKRTIEIHCPDEWKRKTKPKNEKNSFSKDVEGKSKQQMATTIDGKSVITDETPSITRASDDINPIHDQSKQYGISVNNEAQTALTNQGELVSYNERKDNAVLVGDSASSDVVQKSQPHKEYSQNDQKEKAMPANQITDDRDQKIKQLERELYERTQELVDKITQNAKLKDDLRHLELRILQKDDASTDVVHKASSHPSNKEQCSECVTIPREKYGIVRGAMDNSKASISVKFDRNKNFLGADPDEYDQTGYDNSGANHQDGNIQQIQSDDVAFTETKGMMIGRG